jgi:ATP-binding cassette subfamily F protein uup
VNTWAQKFLFHSEQLKAPVRALSGGERARIHIATLMLKEADVLILDEPTNDLDIPSLEVLESSLEEFPGAVMLVTHDRAMLARLATEIVALDGKGNARKYVSYSQWEADEAIRRRQSAATPHGSLAPAVATAPLAPQSPPAPPKPSKRKLTYNEQRELAGMEAAITAAEAEVARIEGEIASSGGDRRAVQDRYTALGVAQAKVAALFERWAFLQGE